MVACPVARRLRASSNTLRRSATPEKTAESGAKCRSVASASRRAIEVLPVPGGPQRIRLGRRSEEHTSELQSLMRISYAVFCLKKKKKKNHKRAQLHNTEG